MWKALEANLTPQQCGEFMYMGSGQGPNRETIHQYKNANTRRYLHISEDGQTFYRYTGLSGAEAFTPIDKAAALPVVFA